MQVPEITEMLARAWLSVLLTGKNRVTRHHPQFDMGPNVYQQDNLVVIR